MTLPLTNPVDLLRALIDIPSTTWEEGPACEAVAAQSTRDPRVDLVIRAHEVHVGDGQVLIDAAIAIDDGRIVEVAAAKSLRSVGIMERRVETLLPGLVATVVPERRRGTSERRRRSAAGHRAPSRARSRGIPARDGRSLASPASHYRSW